MIHLDLIDYMILKIGSMSLSWYIFCEFNYDFKYRGPLNKSQLTIHSIIKANISVIVQIDEFNSILLL